MPRVGVPHSRGCPKIVGVPSSPVRCATSRDTKSSRVVMCAAHQLCRPFRAGELLGRQTQGVALGYPIQPLQGCLNSRLLRVGVPHSDSDAQFRIVGVPRSQDRFVGVPRSSQDRWVSQDRLSQDRVCACCAWVSLTRILMRNFGSCGCPKIALSDRVGVPRSPGCP